MDEESRIECLEEEINGMKESIQAIERNIENIEDFLIPNKYRCSELFGAPEGSNFYPTHRRIREVPEKYSKEKGEAALKRIEEYGMDKPSGLSTKKDVH